MTSLSHLIYSSQISNNDPLSLQRDLADILDVSLLRNTSLSVTGALMAHKGHFTQVLEGDLAAIQTIYKSICSDRRNQDAKLLVMEPLEKRRFPDWAMCVCDPLRIPQANERELRQLKIPDLLEMMQASMTD